MWPTSWAAWINAWLWTRGQTSWQELADGVWIGRAPWGQHPFASVVDLTAELSVPGSVTVPVLDLTLPRPDQLDAAVAAIEGAPRPVFVCCALGYSRSATAAAAWLAATNRAHSAAEAADLVRRARPQVVLRPEAIERLQTWAGTVRQGMRTYEFQR